MSLNFDLTPEEKVIYDILKPGEPKHINELSVISNIQLPVLSGIMIDLEMKNIIKSEHGSIFKVL